MAEFGENIRRAREEMGITQQTLADKLYVTRQAVSRWENGSRYPDLMTAKSLAAALDTSLDELLENDDMRDYPEINPVIEYPLYKRVQTALFTAAFVTNLIQLLWYIGFYVIENRFLVDWEKSAEIISVLTGAVTTGALLFGMIKSARDAVTPRVAAAVVTVIVGADLLNTMALQYINLRNNMLNANVIADTVVYLAVDVLFIAAVLIFFMSSKPRTPVPIYVLAGLVAAMFTASYIVNLSGMIGTAQLTKFMMTSTLRLFAVLLILVLFIYMPAVLYRKRRLAKADRTENGAVQKNKAPDGLDK